jgi:hypothetical protein
LQRDSIDILPVLALKSKIAALGSYLSPSTAACPPVLVSVIAFVLEQVGLDAREAPQATRIMALPRGKLHRIHTITTTSKGFDSFMGEYRPCGL